MATPPQLLGRPARCLLGGATTSATLGPAPHACGVCGHAVVTTLHVAAGTSDRSSSEIVWVLYPEIR